MPKLNFGIADAADQEAAQGYPVYKGELPPNGVYEGILKVMKVGKIGSGADKGKNRLQITIILDDPDHPEFDGCPVFGGLNLTDQGVPYVNQMLEALTDGSDKAKADVKRAFWKTGPIADDAKEHILKIGRLQVNSPRGEIRVMVATRQNTYQGNTTAQVQQYMLADSESGNSKGNSSDDDDVVDDVVEVDDVDVDDVDDEDPYADEDDE